jgi:hypothetical protein
VLIDLISLVVKDYKIYLIVRFNRQRDASELLESASSKSKINTVTCSLEGLLPKLSTLISLSKIDKIDNGIANQRRRNWFIGGRERRCLSGGEQRGR